MIAFDPLNTKLYIELTDDERRRVLDGFVTLFISLGLTQHQAYELAGEIALRLDELVNPRNPAGGAT